MPEETTETITEEVAPSPASNPDDLIATVDESIPASSEETQKTDEKTEEEIKAAATAATKQTQEDDARFDKHPRFQELIQSKNSLKEQVQTLQSKVDEGLKSKETEDPDYKDVSKMTAEEIREWMEEDPVAYTANIAKQIRAEVMKEVDEKSSQRTHEDHVFKTLDNYAAKNKTFDPMWDSGEIQKFMNKNPGHNAMSAHMALTAESTAKDVETRIEEAVKKAQKETEEKIIKDFKAKRGAQVLSAGPTTTGTVQGKIAPELKDPKKFGGNNTVLAERLKQRRQAAIG